MKTLANVKFEINEAGIRELLNSSQVETVIEGAAREVLNKCPDIGYGMTVGKSTGLRIHDRVRAFVGTRSVYSMRDNNKHETLRRAIG